MRRPNTNPLMLVAACATTVAMASCDSGPQVRLDKDVVTRVWTPDWYSETPRGDDLSIYKTAQGVGASPEMAEMLATNLARQEMATAIKSRVDVLQRNFQEQIEAAEDLDLLQRFQNVNAVVASEELYGSHVVRRETYVEDSGDFRTYVLMELDGREVDRNYLDSLKEYEELETRLRSGEAWAELERRARELRRERGGAAPLTDEQIRRGGAGPQ